MPCGLIMRFGSGATLGGSSITAMLIVVDVERGGKP